MPPLNGQNTGQAYWRSLDELADTPEFREFLHREFPAGADEVLAEGGAGRRHFLKIMGASFVLAGLGMAGCRRWPSEKIVPYAERPEGAVPGTTIQYATCMELGGVAMGLLATAYDGRPIKVDGNPNHPDTGGASSAIIQASLLDLYDPDRSRHVMRNGEESDWAAFVQWAETHLDSLRAAGGEGLRVLCEATASPSVMRLRRRVAEAYPGLKWHEYEAISDDFERAGSQTAFGSPMRSQYHLSNAEVIISLDSDFLGSHPQALRHTRDFASKRRPDAAGDSMNRLYVFEGSLSLTGANADDRVAMRRDDVAVIAARIAYHLLPDRPEAVAALAGQSIESSLPDADLQRLIDHVVGDLNDHLRHGVVIAGPAQPAEVHLLVHMINEAIGAVGNTVRYTDLPGRDSHAESMRSLVDAMKAGEVNTLLIIGGNPVYDAPADLGFAAALGSVENRVRLGYYEDETSGACDWHLPRSHYLEAWGDGRAYDGTVSLAQPLIEPLFDTRSVIEVLALVLGEVERDGESIVRRTYNQTIGLAADEAGWRRALHDGVVRQSQVEMRRGAINPTAVAARIQAFADRRAAADWGEVELALTPSNAVFDGRFANNGWLQELPDPLTKLVWDNALLVSVAMASRMGLKIGDMVRVTAGEKSIDVPVMIMPGQADGSVSLALGYGRGFEGRVCTDAGVDAYPMRSTDAMWALSNVEIAKLGTTYPLATTQDHHAIDVTGVGGKDIQKRLPMLFREADLEHYHEHPEFAKHGVHVVHRLSMWEENNLKGAKHRWAMSIDLSACTGCGACITACQAENNIPIVGKDQVTRGREMQWMRVDRYFKFGQTGDGEYDASKLDGVALQPVTCHQCENAPCEQVCPVGATVHDKDGLNAMVYNRCIGTRYCSNNCPYKVRRFNYFDFHRRGPLRQQPGALLQVEPEYYTKGQAKADELKQMQFNPEVTVRMRGVMEKCTFCTQRITHAKVKAKNEWAQGDPDKRAETWKVADGEIQTACQQACPARAIVFGDLNDPDSEVAKLHDHHRAYGMLEELNVKPRLTYMAKLRNPAAVPDGTGDGKEHQAGHAEDSGGGH